MELAAFQRLEDKIDKLLRRLESLKSENNNYKQQLAIRDGEVAELKGLVASRESEREQVRDRIEQLIGRLESLEDAGGEES